MIVKGLCEILRWQMIYKSKAYEPLKVYRIISFNTVHEDVRVVKERVLRTLVEKRVGSIPTPRIFDSKNQKQIP